LRPLLCSLTSGEMLEEDEATCLPLFPYFTSAQGSEYCGTSQCGPRVYSETSSQSLRSMCRRTVSSNSSRDEIRLFTILLSRFANLGQTGAWSSMVSLTPLRLLPVCLCRFAWRKLYRPMSLYLLLPPNLSSLNPCLASF